MILPDTSVWADHLRGLRGPADLIRGNPFIVTHPFVIGEVSLGSLRHRSRVLEAFYELIQLPVATTDEVTALIEHFELHGTGVGYVDAHLLASVRLVSGASLWTRDKRLRVQAERLGVAHAP